MNDRQNMIGATAVAGLILVVVFLCPWRIESSKEIRWSPIYQQPMSYVRSYDTAYGSKGASRISSEEAKIAGDILALEIVILIAVSGGLYVMSSDSRKAKK